jgi:membrane protease YdiL (CAAX protease family)
MSIASALAQTPPADVPVVAGTMLLLILVAMSLLSPWLAINLGIFRPPAYGWPQRFGPDDAAWKFLVLLVAAFLLVQAGGMIMLPFLGVLPQGERVLAAAMLGSVVGLLILPINALLRPDGTRLLGMDAGRMWPGLQAGSASFLITFPWIFWLMLAGSIMLQRFLPELPREHELFRLWRLPETTDFFRVLAVFTAVIVAPLMEEVLFRGFLQTGIARLLTPRARLVYPPEITPVAPDSADSPPPPPPPAPLLPTPAARWTAIIVASALFAAIHRPWIITIPIFILALTLGYVYERTANLWSAIFLHMAFNAFQFAMFLVIVSR